MKINCRLILEKHTLRWNKEIVGIKQMVGTGSVMHCPYSKVETDVQL